MSSGYQLVIRRNKLYKANYRRVVLITLFCLIIVGCLMGFIYYFSLTSSIPKYFPTTPDGRIISMPPLNYNHLRLDRLKIDQNGFIEGLQTIRYDDIKLRGQNALVLDWVEQTIQTIWNMDYVNYRSQIQGFRKYFSSSGYSQYIDAFISSNNIETLKQGKISHAQLKGPAEVTAFDDKGDRFIWYINVPIDVVYESVGEESLVQELLAKLIIIRVPTLESPVYGLAIARAIYTIREDEEEEFEDL